MANLRQRLLYTGIIFLGHLTFGLISGISGASLVDFQYLMNSWSGDRFATIKAVSYSLSCVMAGGILGSFVSFTYKWPRTARLVNRQLLTGLLLLLFAICTVFTPRVHKLYLYFTLSFLGGFGLGNWNTVATTWLLELWSGKKLAGTMQALQLFYGLGSIVGPIIARPYISGYEQHPETLDAAAVERRRARLTVPFVICCSAEALVGIILVVLFFISSLRYRKSSDQFSEQSSHSHEDIDKHIHEQHEVKLFDSSDQTGGWRRTLFWALVLGIFATYNLAEIGQFSFQNTYLQSLHDGVNISAPDAASIASLTATSYTVGRGASVLVTQWISPANLITAHMALALVSFGALTITESLSSLAITLNYVAIGYSFSAVLPALFTYVHSYAHVDDRRNAILFVTLGLPVTFAPFIVGPYIESVPAVLLYLDLTTLAVAAVCFVALRFLVAHTTRHRL